LTENGRKRYIYKDWLTGWMHLATNGPCPPVVHRDGGLRRKTPRRPVRVPLPPRRKDCLSMDDIKHIALETFQAVLPIAVLVVALMLVFVDGSGQMILQFLAGVVMVTVGLGLFLLGVKVGLLPLGEAIGSELPQRGSLVLLMLLTLFIGFAATVAEPDVRVLAYQIDAVSDGEISKRVLVTFVGIGVGVFLAIAAARVVLGIPMAYILTAGYLAVFALSAFVPPHFVPISFDAGGVTTGPMTVPFILALGVGLTSVLGGKSSLGDSFGFVALASIGPIIAVMLLGVFYG